MPAGGSSSKGHDAGAGLCRTMSTLVDRMRNVLAEGSIGPYSVTDRLNRRFCGRYRSRCSYTVSMSEDHESETAYLLRFEEDR